MTQLAVRTPKSWFDLPFTKNETEHCGHGDWVVRTVEEATIRGPYLLIRTRTINGSFPLDEHMQPVGEIWSYSFEETTSVCHASGTNLACQHFTTATAKPRKLEHSLDESKVTWSPATKLSFAKDGTLVVTPPAPTSPPSASK